MKLNFNRIVLLSSYVSAMLGIILCVSGQAQIRTRVSNLPSKTALPISRLVKSPITAVAYSPDGKLLLIGSYQSNSVLDARTLAVRLKLTGIAGPVTSIVFRNDGDTIATSSGKSGQSGEIKLWNSHSGKLLRTITAHSDIIYGLAFRPDGQQLAAASYDHRVSLWNGSQLSGKASSTEPIYLKDHTDSVYGVAYSPDGRELATAAADRTVKVWDTKTGKRLFTLSESTAELYSVAFRPGGKQIAAGGVDHTLRVWDVTNAEGSLAHSAFAHQAAIIRVIYSHDGKSILTIGEDKAVKQWNADTLEEQKIYPTQSDWPYCCAFSTDDRAVAIGCYNGSVVVYNTAIVPEVNASVYNSTQTDSTFNNFLSTCMRFSAEDVSPMNLSPAQAMKVEVPSDISGKLWTGETGEVAPSHFYKFKAKKGETLVLDVLARRAGSPLDSIIEVLDAKGNPVERAVLHAIAQTEVTLTDRDSASPALRLLGLPGIRLNDNLLVGRELIQVNALPKGPDDDTFFRSYRGQRIGFLGTTPEFHSVSTPVYKVEIAPPGTKFSANGMPLTHLYYKNDDGGPLYGRDSYLEFTPPADGEYIVRISDARGQQGENYTYNLRIHPPHPDFKINISPANPTVPKGGSMVVPLESERYDGFTGSISVHLEGLPSGFHATDAVIEPGESAANLLISADMNVDISKPETFASYRMLSKAMIGGSEAIRIVEPDNKNRRLIIGAASNLKVTTDITDVPLRPGYESTVEARIVRMNGFKGRVPIDVRNLPFGVKVVNIGLNGVLVNEQETTRKFTLRCEPWVKPQNRLIYVTANVEGGISATAVPLTLHIGPDPIVRTSAR